MKYINNFKLYCPPLNKYIYIGDKIRFPPEKTEYTLTEIIDDKIFLKEKFYSKPIEYDPFIITSLASPVSIVSKVK